MDEFNGHKSNIKNQAKDIYEEGKETLADAYHTTKETAELYTDKLKDKVSDLYDEGKQKFNTLEDCVEDYSDELVKKVKDNPITSLLIAGGIGFILSKFLRK